MNAVVRLDKSKTKLAQFIQRAQSTDTARPILNGINVNGEVVACDGWRLHSISTRALPELDAFTGETVDLGKIRAGENLLEGEVIDGTFPDYDQIIPKTDPIVVFGANPAFLVDAIKTFDKGEAVTIKVHGPNNPIELHGTIDGVDVYALIMPMHIE